MPVGVCVQRYPICTLEHVTCTQDMHVHACIQSWLRIHSCTLSCLCVCLTAVVTNMIVIALICVPLFATLR
jgi:hypothetical protein